MLIEATRLDDAGHTQHITALSVSYPAMIRKRFFRLCKGPLDGRMISPGTPEYQWASRGEESAAAAFALPGAAGDVAQDTAAAAPSAALHIYEPFDRIDEIWLEIVLCKYVGSRGAAGLN